jgi:hypothetical protein
MLQIAPKEDGGAMLRIAPKEEGGAMLRIAPKEDGGSMLDGQFTTRRVWRCGV